VSGVSQWGGGPGVRKYRTADGLVLRDVYPKRVTSMGGISAVVQVLVGAGNLRKKKKWGNQSWCDNRGSAYDWWKPKPKVGRGNKGWTTEGSRDDFSKQTIGKFSPT